MAVTRADITGIPNDVRLRRIVEYETLFEDSITNIKANNNVFTNNAATHLWSIEKDLSDFSDAWLLVTATIVTTGDNLFSVSLVPQAYDCQSQIWSPENVSNTTGLIVPVAITSATYTAVATATYGLGIYKLPNVHGRFRFGCSCLNTSSGTGSIRVELIGKA